MPQDELVFASNDGKPGETLAFAGPSGSTRKESHIKLCGSFCFGGNNEALGREPYPTQTPSERILVGTLYWICKSLNQDTTHQQAMKREKP